MRFSVFAEIHLPKSVTQVRGFTLGVALYYGSMDKGSLFRSILETRVLLSKGM